MDEQNRQALDSYIKESVAQGFSRSQIEQALLGAGWQADMIAEGFGQTTTVAAEPIPVPEVPPKKLLSARFKWLSIVAAVLVLASGAVWNFWPDPPLDERPVLSPIRDAASSATDTAAPSVSDDITAALPPEEEAESGMQPRDEKRMAAARQLVSALELYYNDANTYPETLQFGRGLMYKQTTYMAIVPTDPLDQEIYHYSYEKTDGGYLITINMESGDRLEVTPDGVKTIQ